MERGHRRRGSENTLWKATYSLIADWAGITPNTAKKYAQRRLFDPHDPHDTMRFIAARRAKRGLTPIGTTT